MTEQQARDLFHGLFEAFPATREWLAKTETPKKTFEVWCRVLSNVDWEDAVVVADGLITGRLDMPKAYDRDKLPQMVRNEANALRAARRDKLRTERICMTAREAKRPSERFMLAMRWSARLGNMVREGKLDAEESRRRTEELVKWHTDVNQPDPEWMEDDQIRKAPESLFRAV